MRKLIVVLILVGVLVAGCSQNKTYSNLFTPPPNTAKTHKANSTLVVKPAGNITVREIGVGHNTTTKQKPAVNPPCGWMKCQLIYARVGWGYYTIHPMIVAFGNNTSRYEAWLNKSVQTTSDVLRYIKDQRWVWVNWSTDKLFVNNTYFRMIAWRKIPSSKVVRTKYWAEFWEMELSKLHNMTR